MASLEQEFAEAWNLYPRKVGKLAADKAYKKARRLASAEQILDGIRQYLGHLPEDLQFIPHFRTWLSQGRWEDDYSEIALPKKPDPKTIARQREREQSALMFKQTAEYLRKLREA